MIHESRGAVKVADARRPDGRLDRLLEGAWRSYRKTFKRCRNQLTPAAVHALRVETRRLLALVDLLAPLLADHSAETISRRLKGPFKTAGRLRDTHVMQRRVQPRLARFPQAKVFQKELQHREDRLRNKLERKIRRLRLEKLKERLGAFRRQLERAADTPAWRRRAALRLGKRLDEAFADVAERRRKIVPANPLTIHRTRVAFKKFRYLVEQLQPLLPLVSKALPGQLREHQRLMGDIQDCEILLRTLDKFISRAPDAGCPLRKFHVHVEHEHAALTAKYLSRADELFAFWKPAAPIRRAKP